MTTPDKHYDALKAHWHTTKGDTTTRLKEINETMGALLVGDQIVQMPWWQARGCLRAFDHGDLAMAGLITPEEALKCGHNVIGDPVAHVLGHATKPNGPQEI